MISNHEAMTLATRLRVLVDHFDPQVQQVGKLLTGLKADLDAGNLTKEEYEELIRMAQSLEKIIAVSDDLITYATIHAAIEGVVQVAKLAKFV